MSRPAARSVRAAAFAGAALCSLALVAAEPAPSLTTWDGRHPIARIEATVVHFVPADREVLPDWRERAEWFARRIEAFHAREFQGRSELVARVEEAALVSRLPTAALREGDADAIFFRTLREADERLSFARETRAAFPVLVVLSDINWRPLDDFHRLSPRGTGWEFEGALYPDGIHVPGAASGGARATYLAEAGNGWGLVSADGWRVPYRGSDCVVYHEGVGHAIGLPHPQQPTADVMSQGQYRVTLGQSWVDDAQKRTLGWRQVAGFDAAAHALFSGFTAAPEPAVPRPGQAVALRLGFPEGVAVTLPVVEFQTSLRGPWTSVAVPATALSDGLVPLGRFDRPCPVAWRARVRRAQPQGTADDAAELWGYFQVRSEPGTPPLPTDVDPRYLPQRDIVAAAPPCPREGSPPAIGERRMIAVSNVSKSFAGQRVLAPTNLDVPRGRTTVLIGPSGCGKSTLLRIIVGLITPDSGGVTIDGEPMTAATALELRRRIGYVIQDGGLFPHLSGRDNVTLLARRRGRDPDWIRRRVDELADLVRLPQAALDRPPGALSGGQRQRLGIMRALALDPPVVLLDEPLGALDPLVRYDLQEDLRRIFRELAKTVVLVTHDMGEAGFFGDEIVLLGGGTIVQRGTLDALIHSPADESVRRFILAHRLPGMTAGDHR